MFYFNLRLAKSPIYSKCRSSVQLFNHLLTLFEFFISNKGLMVDLIFFWLSWDTFFYGKHCLSSVSSLLFLRRIIKEIRLLFRGLDEFLFRLSCNRARRGQFSKIVSVMVFILTFKRLFTTPEPLKLLFLLNFGMLKQFLIF
jgi:hypothetical protein